MRKILILMGRYLPGYKDGGPVRTIKNLTDLLGKEYDIRIMCQDRDRGDLEAYSGISVNSYNKVGNAKVYYVKEGNFKFKILLKEIRRVDVVYCCGPYNKYAIKIVILKKLGLFRQQLVIASMGSFSKGALSLKYKKKMFFLSSMKKLGFFKNIIWSVTSIIEEFELRQIFGDNAKCIIAEDLPRIEKVNHRHKKEKNQLKIVFISRISKMKNLLGAIDILSRIKDFPIQFDIYGNIEDENYWNKCQHHLKMLKNNIIWEYRGECDSNIVVNTFSDYDIFLLPTFGENFGHVISESLIAGCIPVISNNTPWLDLNKYQCGNVISLKNIEDFVQCLNKYVLMDENEFKIYVNNAQNYINKKNQICIENTGYREIFN